MCQPKSEWGYSKRWAAYALVMLGASWGLLEARAADWNQWRGPERDGRIGGFAPPASWPEMPAKAWEVEVGEGHASPVVAGGRVYVHSRQGDEEVVLSFDLATGERIWRRAYPAPYTMHQAAIPHGKGPKSTPTVVGGRIFTLGISGIISAFDARDGKLLWRRDHGKEFPRTSPLYGASMSPLVDGTRVIVHLGGHDEGALLAFDVGSGKEVWRWDGDGPGYASPVMAELGGVRQLVTQSQDHLIGVRPADGKLLWSYPFSTEYSQNAVTPLIDGDQIIVSGTNQGIVALRPRLGEGGAWAVEPVWHHEERSFYMSSPVRAAGRICGLVQQRRGTFLCLDRRSGELLWASEGRGGDNASVVLAGGYFLILDDGGELTVLSAEADGYKPTALYEMADRPTWAHLAPLEDGILVKDKTHLTRWRLR